MSRRITRRADVTIPERRLSESVVPLCRSGVGQSDENSATPPEFGATEERFIDFLVEEALKAWRTKTS